MEVVLDRQMVHRDSTTVVGGSIAVVLGHDPGGVGLRILAPDRRWTLQRQAELLTLAHNTLATTLVRVLDRFRVLEVDLELDGAIRLPALDIGRDRVGQGLGLCVIRLPGTITNVECVGRDSSGSRIVSSLVVAVVILEFFDGGLLYDISIFL